MFSNPTLKLFGIYINTLGFLKLSPFYWNASTSEFQFSKNRSQHVGCVILWAYMLFYEFYLWAQVYSGLKRGDQLADIVITVFFATGFIAMPIIFYSFYSKNSEMTSFLNHIIQMDAEFEGNFVNMFYAVFDSLPISCKYF